METDIFLFRTWAFSFVTGGADTGVRETVPVAEEAEEIRRAIHKVVKKIGEDLEHLRFKTLSLFFVQFPRSSKKENEKLKFQF